MNKPTLKEQAHGEIEKIFRILLPQNGLSVREEQITLCHAMLDTLLKNNIALCDAGVGIGKTYAYLTACILLKKFAPHGPAGSQPVVISTSSVALQDSIIEEYIPFLSRIFLENRVISKPIRAIVRKGKERFVCDARLSQRLEAVKDKNKNAKQLKALLSLRTYYDLDSVTGLSGFDRRQVCVPKVCEKTCPLRSACRYHQYLKEARSAEIFVQICNHNYLLADAAHRLQELRPLLNDYRALVIDEAHKLPDAARQMYGKSLSAEDFSELCTLLAKEKYALAAQRLKEKFTALMGAMCRGELLEEAQRTAFVLTPDREAALRDCLSLLRQIQKQLALHLPRWILYQLGTTEQTLNLFFTGDRKYILYIQYDRDGSPSLCAATREMPEQLRHALWSKETPAILTSGTLMAGGSFDRTRQLMGLSANNRLDDFIAVSPFDYQENCLLYIPDDMPKAQMGSEKEAKCLSEQICRLVETTHGHTLVLFTSYSLMGAVYKEGHFAFRYKNFLGYRPGENGEPEIDPEQATIVSRIFFAFLSGDTPEQIAKSLEADHIPSPTGKPTWSKTTIRNMLQNEKYAGDVLLQKTYTADFLEKKVKKNRGEVKQYYITDNHPAIIPRDIFQEVQLEIARRSSKRKVSCRRTKSGRGKYTSKYALSERTVCGECGAMYRRTMWIKRDRTKEDVWRCVNRLEFGTKYCKHSPSLKEPILHQAILNCIQSVFHNKEEIAEAVREAQKKIILFEDAKNNPEVIRQRMQDIDHGMANLLTLAAQSSQIELFEKKFKEMTEEKARLTEQLKQAEEDATTDAKRQKQLDDILKAIDIDIVELTEFDDTFIRRIVEQVTILSKDKIEVRFIGGFSKVGDIPTK